VTAQAPLDRLAPEDFYRQLDHVRDDWDADEWRIARKLTKLRRLYEQLPLRYWDRAQPLLGVLVRARIANGQPWQAALLQLRAVVSEWDRARPPLLDCEICGVPLRGHPALANHYEIVHPLEAVPAVPSG